MKKYEKPDCVVFLLLLSIFVTETSTLLKCDRYKELVSAFFCCHFITIMILQSDGPSQFSVCEVGFEATTVYCDVSSFTTEGIRLSRFKR
jgi:hypothetical protein